MALRIFGENGEMARHRLQLLDIGLLDSECGLAIPILIQNGANWRAMRRLVVNGK